MYLATFHYCLQAVSRSLKSNSINSNIHTLLQLMQFGVLDIRRTVIWLLIIRYVLKSGIVNSCFNRQELLTIKTTEFSMMSGSLYRCNQLALTAEVGFPVNPLTTGRIQTQLLSGGEIRVGDLSKLLRKHSADCLYFTCPPCCPGTCSLVSLVLHNKRPCGLARCNFTLRLSNTLATVSPPSGSGLNYSFHTRLCSHPGVCGLVSRC